MRDIPPLTLNDARRHTGLDLVSAEDVCEPVSGCTYADMERASESPTHARLRELAIQVFTAYGYRVYPSGVGVRGFYTMADLLAVRDQRVVFIEVLTDAKATPTDLRQKQQLAVHGELVFVFIGNIKDRDSVALDIQAKAAQTHDVLLGRWGWGKCDWLAPIHPFQRFGFALTRDQLVTIGADVTTVGKRINLKISLITVPYPISIGGLLEPEPTKAALSAYVRRVADAMAAKLHAKWGKPRSGYSILTDIASGKRLAKRLVPGSRRHHHENPFDPLSIDLEPAAAIDAIAATRQVAEEYRLALDWTGAAHEAVAKHAASHRTRTVKAIASADVAALLQVLRATDDVIVYRLDMLRTLAWTAHRGNRVIRQLVADGVLWCSTMSTGQMVCGLRERQRPPQS